VYCAFSGRYEQRVLIVVACPPTHERLRWWSRASVVRRVVGEESAMPDLPVGYETEGVPQWPRSLDRGGQEMERADSPGLRSSRLSPCL